MTGGDPRGEGADAAARLEPGLGTPHAPVPVAAYISVVPKIAALAGLARLLTLALPGDLLGWSTALAVVAAVTMIFGAVAMIPQRCAVRLLAYSSISQTGFMLIAIAALPRSGDAAMALVYFFAAYAVANLATFAVLQAVARETGSTDVDALAGLGRKHPWWTTALVLAVLSLFGLPPLGGFVAKLTVFGAAIAGGQAWLAVIGIIATVISLYPYLRLIAPAILNPRPDRRPPVESPALGRVLGPALAISAGACLAFGVGAQPLLDVAEDSTAMGPHGVGNTARRQIGFRDDRPLTEPEDASRPETGASGRDAVAGAGALPRAAVLRAPRPQLQARLRSGQSASRVEERQRQWSPRTRRGR